jgi:hypothetical protein
MMAEGGALDSVNLDDGLIKSSAVNMECVIRETMISDVDLRVLLDVVLTVCGSRVSSSPTIASFLIAKASEHQLGTVDSAVSDARPATARAGFGSVWGKARGADQAGAERRSRREQQLRAAETLLGPLAELEHLGEMDDALGFLRPVVELRTKLEHALGDEAGAVRRRALVNAAATNDVAAVGQLLGAQDVNKVTSQDIPEALGRRQSGAPLLDVAVGCAAVQVVKYLLEFHGAIPSRETLKMAISSGSLELVRWIVGRLPEAELDRRFDLTEVAADFHRPDLLAWLLRDASLVEREIFASRAIGQRLADALLVAIEIGMRPHRAHARRAAGLWAPRRSLREILAPGGIVPAAGWGWCVAGSFTTPLGPVDPFELDVVLRREVTEIVLPSGVTRLWPGGCSRCGCLTSVVMRRGLTVVGEGAFGFCCSLVDVTIPEGVIEIGRYAFFYCPALVIVTIPRSCILIGECAFAYCQSLVDMTMPLGCHVDARAFDYCPKVKLIRLGEDGREAGWMKTVVHWLRAA